MIPEDWEIYTYQVLFKEARDEESGGSDILMMPSSIVNHIVDIHNR